MCKCGHANSFQTQRHYNPMGRRRAFGRNRLFSISPCMRENFARLEISRAQVRRIPRAAKSRHLFTSNQTSCNLCSFLLSSAIKFVSFILHTAERESSAVFCSVYHCLRVLQNFLALHHCLYG